MVSAVALIMMQMLSTMKTKTESRIAYILSCLCLETDGWMHRVLSRPINVRKSKITVKILKFGTPQTIAITVLKIEKFDVTLH